MPIKETSDTLDPSVVATTHIVVPASRRTAGDYVALAAATCGVGFIPVASGTWGSLVGVGVFLIFEMICGRAIPRPPLVEKNIESAEGIVNLLGGFDRASQWRLTALLVLIIIISAIGVWAATRAEKLLRRKDPGAVVIDEVAGQLITFVFVPLNSGAWSVVLGFVLFRLFDIWKPYPVRRLEALESGLGIMADDVLAGFYAAVVLALAASVRTLV